MDVKDIMDQMNQAGIAYNNEPALYGISGLVAGRFVTKGPLTDILVLKKLRTTYLHIISLECVITDENDITLCHVKSFGSIPGEVMFKTKDWRYYKITPVLMTVGYSPDYNTPLAI